MRTQDRGLLRLLFWERVILSRDKGHLIAAVEPGSAAEELEIRAGDRLLSVNGKRIEDVFDYRYQVNAECVTLLILKPNGEEWELEIENGCEDPGLVFENGLMSDYRSCSNGCIFCFIDQMPKGMRDTLYFKDDDSRLSFLQGNYITLTNMQEKDIRHIIDYRLEPINISVHTTNPELRKRMLHNRFAGGKLRFIRELYEAGIEMNGQIVLCKGWNDGAELERTVRDLLEYAPVMQSVSVVPVGLTDYRDKLCPLEPILKEDAAQTIDIVEHFQQEAVRRCGLHFIHASDEFYLTAERELPEAGRYDGYLQLENGVGMLRLLTEEVDEALSVLEPLGITETVSSISGMLAAPSVGRELQKIAARLPEKKLLFYPLVNHFFGERITVTGLLTGRDILDGLRGKELGDRLLLPQCIFRSGEEVLLDDMTREQLEHELGVRCVIIGSSGADLVNAVNDPDYVNDPVHGEYELPEDETVILNDEGEEEAVLLSAETEGIDTDMKDAELLREEGERL